MGSNVAADESVCQKKRWMQICFLIYLLILIKLIVFKYPAEQLREIASAWRKDVIWEGLDTANFTPFQTIRMYIIYADRLNSFENLVGNVIAFVPFGFLFPYVYPYGQKFFILFLNVFLFVLGIEIFQLFSAFGVFDVDDIILNCLGAVWGYLFFVIHRAWKRKKTHCGKEGSL